MTVPPAWWETEPDLESYLQAPDYDIICSCCLRRPAQLSLFPEASSAYLARGWRVRGKGSAENPNPYASSHTCPECRPLIEPWAHRYVLCEGGKIQGEGGPGIRAIR